MNNCYLSWHNTFYYLILSWCLGFLWSGLQSNVTWGTSFRNRRIYGGVNNPSAKYLGSARPPGTPWPETQLCKWHIQSNSTPSAQNGGHFGRWQFSLHFLMKIIEFRFHLNLFTGVQLPIGQPNRRQTITWTKADLVHRRIYAAREGDELTH